MKVAVLKYNAGNIRSVLVALNRLGIEPVLSDSPHELNSCDKYIFPGVGEASSAMNYLRDNQLDVYIKAIKKPFLGICLGMQLLCAISEEGDTECMNIFEGVKIKHFNKSLSKVPQIGWNTIKNLTSELFRGITENEYMYFVHSYYAEPNPYQLATTHYQTDYCSAMKKDNFYAVQFHPEKSSAAGEMILRNFLEL